MLYTVRPLERVFADLRDDNHKDENSDKIKSSGNDLDYKEELLPHGRVVTRREGKDYVVERVYSTDMSDYLNEQFSPGKVFKKSAK